MNRRKGGHQQNRAPSNFGDEIEAPSRSLLRSRAGMTLVETLVGLVVLVIGLAGAFSTSAQCYAMLRRAKELVSAREDLLSRLDTLRTLSFSQLTNPTYISATLLVSGTAGDPSPFGSTTAGMNNFKETVTVYALGAQLFSNDSQRNNATPDSKNESASQIDSIAPAAPKAYISTSTTQGAWASQAALPYIQVTRVGTGSSAATTINASGDIPFSTTQLLVNVVYTWTDSKGATRTQIGSTIVSNSGSLP